MEDAVAATIPASDFGSAFDSDSPRWPDENEESSFLTEQRAAGIAVVPTPAKLAEENELDRQPLPKLDDLIARIPPNVQQVLEDLFRAKFNAVRRVPAAVLKKSE